MDSFFSGLWNIVFSGAAYDIIRGIGVSLIVALASSVIVRRVFNKLEPLKELTTFFGSVFIIVLVIFWALGTRPQAPRFVAGIQSVASGAWDKGQDTVAVLTMSVINTGTMQSITKQWSVHAIANGVTYTPIFATMPAAGFTFGFPDKGPGHPQSMTYHKEDDLLEKSISPIPPGGVQAGILFVIFQDVDPEVFKSGADFVVTFQDALSDQYTASIKSTAHMDDIPIVPGLHTDLVCRMPPSSTVLPPNPAKASDVR